MIGYLYEKIASTKKSRQDVAAFWELKNIIWSQ